MPGFDGGFTTLQAGLSASGFGSGLVSPARLVDDGLVLHYKISDPSSYSGSGATIVDLAGNSNATLNNAPSYSSGYLTFNGSNQYLITNTSLASKVTTDLTTISMWAYPLDNGILLTERGESSLASGWHDSQMEMVGGTMRFGMWSTPGIAYLASSVPTPLNNWYNFVMTYDGTKLNAYVNGQPAGSATFSRLNPIEGSTGIFYAIASGDLTNMGDGTYASMRLGQFLVHNRALTADEVTKNFNATRRIYGI